MATINVMPVISRLTETNTTSPPITPPTIAGMLDLGTKDVSACMYLCVPRSEEGSSDQQMSPELLNNLKTFSTKCIG